MVSLLEFVITAGSSCIIAGVLNGIKSAAGNNGKDPSDSLVRRAKKGDHAAYGELVEMYQQRIYYSVIRIALNHDDANDIVQESFVKAFRNIDTFKEGYRFYTWLYRIAINTALNHVQQKRHKEHSLNDLTENRGFNPETDRDLEGDIEQSEMLQNVKKALEYVPADMRTVFVLRVYKDMSYQEIADTLNISIGTVMSRLHRARNTLKEHLVKNGWFQDQF